MQWFNFLSGPLGANTIFGGVTVTASNVPKRALFYKVCLDG